MITWLGCIRMPGKIPPLSLITSLMLIYICVLSFLTPRANHRGGMPPAENLPSDKHIKLKIQEVSVVIFLQDYHHVLHLTVE